MAPCGWPTEPSAGACTKWTTFDSTVQVAAAALATGFLYAATGRRFGPCPVVVQPCQPPQTGGRWRTYPVTLDSFGDAGGMGLLAPYIDEAGVVRNCGCGAGCCCDARCEVELAGPVADVTEVTVDGAVVAPASYRVDVQRGVWLLVRHDGVCWPTCADFSDPDPNFTVAYDRGEPIPAELTQAWGTLVCEYGKALCGGGDCRLPARVQSMTRQGVSIEMRSASQSSLGFEVGLPEVDAVVATLNPGRLASRPVVYSPDIATATDRVTVIPQGS